VDIVRRIGSGKVVIELPFGEAKVITKENPLKLGSVEFGSS
jgi:hypothetical protein